jgi:hypothetical protein
MLQWPLKHGAFLFMKYTATIPIPKGELVMGNRFRRAYLMKPAGKNPGKWDLWGRFVQWLFNESVVGIAETPIAKGERFEPLRLDSPDWARVIRASVR